METEARERLAQAKDQRQMFMEDPCGKIQREWEGALLRYRIFEKKNFCFLAGNFSHGIDMQLQTNTGADYSFTVNIHTSELTFAVK